MFAKSMMSMAISVGVAGALLAAFLGAGTEGAELSPDKDIDTP
jgi:hypothetical protein